MGAIYIISNDVNNKVYIGQTEQQSVNRRFLQHKREATHGASEAKLYVAMREIGIEHFSVNMLLDDITADVLDVMEVYFINKYDSYNNGYNSTIGGTMGRNFIYKNTILTKDHIDPEYIARSIVDAFFENSL